MILTYSFAQQFTGGEMEIELPGRTVRQLIRAMEARYPAIAGQLFQAFVSTKSSGMGLGLSICRTIVEAHGGRIRAGTGAEGGAEFQFTLPMAQGEED